MYGCGASSCGATYFGHVYPGWIRRMCDFGTDYGICPKTFRTGGFHGSTFPVELYILRPFPLRYPHMRWIRNIALGNF